jgi:hypothetical protein
MISVVVREHGRQEPLPCRAWVEAGGRRLFNPSGGSCIAYPKDRSFSCDGRFTLQVPAGPVRIHVERGKEYRPVDREVTVAEQTTADVAIILHRWVDMPAEGWYSGDIHCHFAADDPDGLKQLALADDVHYEPVLSLWNQLKTKSAEPAWGQYADAPDLFADASHVVTLRNIEIERIGGRAYESVGALLMFGLRAPVEIPVVRNKFPCDAMLLQAARQTSPDCVIDTDKPIWGENVVGVALGYFDSVQVCHNHYHREATLPAGWGMAGISVSGEEGEVGKDELFHRTNETYYRFLNCGFRLAATGGSAMGVMPVPLGYNRTYAKIEGPLCEKNYLEAIRRGRTFATSGPILILTVEGQDCGATIKRQAGDGSPVQIRARLRTIEPVNSLELIDCGKVIGRLDLKGRGAEPVLDVCLEHALVPDKSGWIAARALFKAPDGCLRQAHTSPIYFAVDDKPIASQADAEYLMGWIDKLLEISRQPGRYASDEQRSQVQRIFRQARAVYEDIAAKAPQ